MVVLGVVAGRHGVNIVELVSVETPIANETLRELLVVGLHFRQRGAQRRQIPGHARRLPGFVQHQPVRMFFHNVGDDILAPPVTKLTVFDRSGNHQS